MRRCERLVAAAPAVLVFAALLACAQPARAERRLAPPGPARGVRAGVDTGSFPQRVGFNALLIPKVAAKGIDAAARPLSIRPPAIMPARAAAPAWPDDPERVLARFHHEPAVADVQRAAARWVGAERSRARSWLARVRKAPWLPELRVRAQKGYEDDLLTNANGHTRATDDDLTLELSLRWQLDRVVFDRNELYVSRESMLLAELRRDIVAEATRLYFQRRRVQVELLLTPRDALRTRLRLMLQAEELAAELDGITGGFFRRALGGIHENRRSDRPARPRRVAAPRRVP